MEDIILTSDGQVKTVLEVQTDLATYIENQQRIIEDIDREITQATKRKEDILAKLQQLLTPLESTVVVNE